jgi:hypothetical protein
MIVYICSTSCAVLYLIAQGVRGHVSFSLGQNSVLSLQIAKDHSHNQLNKSSHTSTAKPS